MNEKISISDTLSDVNGLIRQLNYSIEQANNETFRNNLIEHRNNLENIQFKIYEIAKEKGYYIPAAPAGKADIEQVKNSIS